MSKGLVKAGDTEFLKSKLIPTADSPPQTSASEFENPQLNLFQNFLYNKESERENLSNAIDFWDSVPRYSVSHQAMSKARMHGQFLKKNTMLFQYRSRTYACTISPARITDVDGQERDYYPSNTEELVEDALRKMALEQHAGFFDKPNYRSGVVFSIYGLQEELGKRGHSRSFQQIIHALNVLSKSIIEITSQDDEKGEVMAVSAYLPSLVAVSKKRLKDDPKAKWSVQFHPFVTGSIDKVTYRQFNYHKMMSHDSQLARWLHKQLVLKYTFADFTKTFEMRYSTVKRDSGLLNSYSRERAAIQAVEDAFKGLQTHDIISAFDRKDIRAARRKLIDVVFTIWPSHDFIKEAKAANKRVSIR